MNIKNKPDFSGIKVLYINCTLETSPTKSNTEGLMQVSMNIMKAEKVTVEYLRLVDHTVAYGVHPDMTEHGIDMDEWPEIYGKVQKVDILANRNSNLVR